VSHRAILLLELAIVVLASHAAAAEQPQTTPPAAPAKESPSPSQLEFREITDSGIARSGTAIPRDAVEVFAYEGQPEGIRVGPEHIAVDYGHSGVQFDRKTGQLAKRWTVADGWPAWRPSDFPPAKSRSRDRQLGPGVLNPWLPGPGGVFVPPRKPGETVKWDYLPVATVEFDGKTWEAMQPAGFLNSLDRPKDWKRSWSGILKELDGLAYLQAKPKSGGEPVRYGTKDGLAANIISHLAVADGKLWAACVDIYDPEKKAWGPGGLCVFDPKTRRWQRIDQVDGRPVRWFTLLQAEGDSLWVGFREGSGVDGDQVTYGMGLYPDQYRPVTKAIVLARLSGGKWKTFSRQPLAMSDRAERIRVGRPENEPAPKPSSTEEPRSLAMVEGKLFLFSETFARASGNWDVARDGQISLLDLASGTWQTFDAGKDFGAYRIDRMTVENGEVLAATDRGAHRWSAGERKWLFLDPKSPIQNPTLFAAAAVGDELWVGYNNQSFGVLGRQGISRFNEKTLRWSWDSPKEIGTGCPVQSIVPGREGDVWVLFQRRFWGGAAMEWSFYNDPAWGDPGGVARFNKGKWEFPPKLDGVPLSRKRERQGPNGLETWTEQFSIGQIVSAGGKLFVVNGAGIYAGPGQWKQVVEGPVLGLHPSEDGKTLVFTREVSRETTGQTEFERGSYDLATGKTTLEKVERPSWDEWNARHASLLSHSGAVYVPTKKPGRWVVGGTECRAIVETPRAVWIASEGQLIRLDREKLGEWLGR
jgi:hypothetical protein